MDDRKMIAGECSKLGSMTTQGELGKAIADIVLSYSPRDLEQMRWNFSGAIHDINPELRKKLEETITGHLNGTYQALRLMNQQGNFTRMREPLAKNAEFTGRWLQSNVLRGMQNRSG
jgi:hypothetical protein